MMGNHELEETVLSLYRNNKWKDIVNLKDLGDDFETHRILWVWPSFDDLSFIEKNINRMNLKGIVSIGCGSGLFEWLIQQYSGLEVIGLEVDRLWWSSGYSPPLFLKNTIFIDEDNNNVDILPSHAILFCYFNNESAFYSYIENYRGNMVLVIGPGEGRGSHTNPTPFDDKFAKLGWKLDETREIRNTKDYIAVYIR